MPGKTQSRAGVLDAPMPRDAMRSRSTSESSLEGWSRPESWHWLDGRWAISGTLMGVPVAPPDDTVRLVVSAEGVAFESPIASARPLLTFEDGRPTVLMEGVAGAGTAALRAVSATRRSVTFQDVLTATIAVPAVLKVTIRRVGPNIFHVVGDTAVGADPIPMLAYTALKLNSRG